jgi:hypothetical protein
VTTDATPKSPAYLEGFRLGAADVAAGAMTLICGGGPETAEKVQGYWAGRTAAERGRQAGLEAGS